MTALTGARNYVALTVALSALILGTTAAHATSVTTWNIWPGGSIQLGIDLAADGDTVQVHAGTYRENLVWTTKDITLIGDGAATTIVNGDVDSDGTGDGRCLTITNVPATARVEGFTFTNGLATGSLPANWGGGLYLDHSPLTVADNIIAGNTATDGGGLYLWQSAATLTGNAISGNTAVTGANGGGGLMLNSSDATLMGNNISDNTAAVLGGGMVLSNSDATITGNTIARNTASSGGGIYCSSSSPVFTNTIIAFAASGGGIHFNSNSTAFFYCDLYGNTGGNYVGMEDQTGTNGNISQDPLFADAAGGDYHLKSRGGHWTAGGWVADPVHSPCIDTGDPGAAFVNEPAPNGDRINMGAFGNTAQASKWANQPPSVASVTISPDPARTDDDLTATPSGWSDPDGDPEGYDWQWAEWNAGTSSWDDIPGATTDTLTSNNFVKSDQIQVTCWANDGTVQGTLVTDEITISNTAPTQPTVDVTPDNPKTGDDLQVAAPGSIDADGDAITYHYEWYKDDVHQAAYDDETTIPSAGTTRGEVWRCEVTPNDGTDDGPSDQDEMTVGNTAPTQPTVSITPPNPGTNDSFRCVGSGSADADGDSVSYSYQWYKNDVLQPGVTWQRIGASRTRRGQTWQCVVTPNDGTDNGPTGEDQVTIGNTVPTQPTVVITPGDPTSSDNFRATASSSTDADDDTVSYSYQWYKNDVLQARCVWPGIAAWRTSSGQVWRCVVTPSDGTSDGPSGENLVTIGNAAPTAPTVVITPGDPTTADSFRAAASGSTDADDDSVSYSYQWYKNGVLQARCVWPGVGAWRTSAGQVWRCVVTPTDGTDDGPTGEASVTVANSAPTAPTVVITPGSPTTADSFRATASGSTDADGDSVSYSYQWYKNGVLQPGLTWQRIGATRTRVGQTWRCVVTPNDGLADGPTGEASVIIGGKSAGPLTVTGLAALPTARGAEIAFTLSAHAAVTCEVLNIAGRAVKTIVSDRPMAEGINSLAWDGRNAGGLRAPAGMYMVRMTAATTGGARWTSIGTLNLTR